MIRVFDFRCPYGHVVERFVEDDCRVVACMQGGCPEYAFRQVAGPRSKLEGITGAFPGAADKWARDRQSHIARERKYMESHNETLPGVKPPKV